MEYIPRAFCPSLELIRIIPRNQRGDNCIVINDLLNTRTTLFIIRAQQNIVFCKPFQGHRKLPPYIDCVVCSGVKALCGAGRVGVARITGEKNPLGRIIESRCDALANSLNVQVSVKRADSEGQ